MNGDSDQDGHGGEEAALFCVVYPGLRRFAAVVAPADVDPDDLVQEAVARVLRQRSLTNLDSPAAFLSRAILNLASNERRRQGRWLRSARRLGTSDGPSPSVYPSDLGDLESLSPRERGTVYLHDVEGRSFDEVAVVLGCSTDAARQAASRGRRHLRTLLEEGA